jgi:hypothetical protein
VERPTTRRPIILTGPDVDASFLQLDDCDPQLERLDVPLLNSVILIDCPDPDTQGSGFGVQGSAVGGQGPGVRSQESGSIGQEAEQSTNRNSETLRRVLPHCDVMLVTGTAQKYKTEAVAAEVLRHAPGRQVLFVQTHAAVDADIREDWRRQLESQGFAVPEIFRIDSEEALLRQARGQSPGSEFDRLIALSQRELAGKTRHRIRRANALDLFDWVLNQIAGDCDRQLAGVVALEEAIIAEQQKLFESVRRRLHEQLQGHQSLWRQRLLRQVTLQWSAGPFAAFLRIVNGASSLLRMAILSRARGIAPLVLAGGAAAAKALADRWRQSWEQGEWNRQAASGIRVPPPDKPRWRKRPGNCISGSTQRLRRQQRNEPRGERAPFTTQC